MLGLLQRLRIVLGLLGVVVDHQDAVGLDLLARGQGVELVDQPADVDRMVKNASPPACTARRRVAISSCAEIKKIGGAGALRRIAASASALLCNSSLSTTTAAGGSC